MSENTREIEVREAEDLIDGMPVEGHADWRQVQTEFNRNTRWGSIHQVIWREGNDGSMTGTFWAFSYERPSGDGEWDPFDGAKQVTCFKVKPKQKLVTVYEQDHG